MIKFLQIVHKYTDLGFSRRPFSFRLDTSKSVVGRYWNARGSNNFLCKAVASITIKRLVSVKCNWCHVISTNEKLLTGIS